MYKNKILQKIPVSSLYIIYINNNENGCLYIYNI